MSVPITLLHKTVVPSNNTPLIFKYIYCYCQCWFEVPKDMNL